MNSTWKWCNYLILIKKKLPNLWQWHVNPNQSIHSGISNTASIVFWKSAKSYLRRAFNYLVMFSLISVILPLRIDGGDIVNGWIIFRIVYGRSHSVIFSHRFPLISACTPVTSSGVLPVWRPSRMWLPYQIWSIGTRMLFRLHSWNHSFLIIRIVSMDKFPSFKFHLKLGNLFSLWIGWSHKLTDCLLIKPIGECILLQ